MCARFNIRHLRYHKIEEFNPSLRSLAHLFGSHRPFHAIGIRESAKPILWIPNPYQWKRVHDSPKSIRDSIRQCKVEKEPTKKKKDANTKTNGRIVKRLLASLIMSLLSHSIRSKAGQRHFEDVKHVPNGRRMTNGRTQRKITWKYFRFFSFRFFKMEFVCLQSGQCERILSEAAQQKPSVLESHCRLTCQSIVLRDFEICCHNMSTTNDKSYDQTTLLQPQWIESKMCNRRKSVSFAIKQT